MESNVSIFLLIFFLTLPIPILLLKSLLRHNRKQKARRPTPPGPPPIPIIGNFHQLGSASLPETFARLSKEYGPLLYLKLGSKSVLVANSVETADELLIKSDLKFCSRPSPIAFRKLSYNCANIAFSPYNDYWGSFWEALLNETITRLTSTIVSRVAFGKRYVRGTAESKLFYRMVHMFERSLSSFYLVDYFPWLGWIDRWVGNLDRLDEAFQICDSFYQELIDEHLLSYKTKAADEADMIDILLRLREEDQSLDIALEHIKAVLMDVYFASTDTTATTITWIMTALIKNPKAMKKVVEEIRESMKGKQELNEEHILTVKLPYLDAAIKEAMRLYPTVPLLLPRETVQECSVDGYEIPAKTLVYVNSWAISRDPSLWEDPSEFLPERFLPNGDKHDVDCRTSVELTPFGAGRRGCPGINMALSVIEIIVANLLYHFDWEMVGGLKNEDLDDEIQEGLTLHRKNPLRLVPKKVILSV